MDNSNDIHPSNGYLFSEDNFRTDIFFSDLTDEVDYEKCFLWEIYRTRHHLSQVVSDKDWSFELHGELFPFNNPQWPSKAYLSSSIEVRESLDITDQPIYDWNRNIFKAKRTDIFNASNQSYVDDGYTEESYTETLSESVPLTLEIGPHWDEKALKQVLLNNIKPILAKTKNQEKDFIKKGYKFIGGSVRRPKSQYKSALKALGHFRLLHKHCCNLKFEDLKEVLKPYKPPQEFLYSYLEAYRKAKSEKLNGILGERSVPK
jgi:hypothetical protein